MAEEVFKYVQIGGEEYRIEKFAPVPGLQLARLTLAKLTPVAEKLTGGGEEVLAALCAAVSIKASNGVKRGRRYKCFSLTKSAKG